MSEQKPFRVWIELEQPKDNAEGHERARLLSNMINRLNAPQYQRDKPVWWFEDKQCYCFEIDHGGSFVMANDRGHWFNLNWFGRD